MVDSINKINFNSSTELSGIKTCDINNTDIVLFEASNLDTAASPAKKLSNLWSNIISKANNSKTSISEDFFKELIRFAKEIKTNPLNFVFILFAESRFDPKAKNGDFLGLIQMDSTSFTECAIGMMEYEKYCKDHPKEKITLQDYKKLANKKDFKKPNIGSNRITYSAYKNLSREKQLKYAEAYLKYRIHEKGINGKQLSSEQLWGLIHRPRYYNTPSEINNRRKELNRVKDAIKTSYPEEYKQIINAIGFKVKG